MGRASISRARRWRDALRRRIVAAAAGLGPKGPHPFSRPPYTLERYLLFTEGLKSQFPHTQILLPAVRTASLWPAHFDAMTAVLTPKGVV
jgi:hypothetical protein